MLRNRLAIESISALGPTELCHVAGKSLLERRSDISFWKAIRARAVEISAQLNSTQAARLIHNIQSADASSNDSVVELTRVITDRSLSKSVADSISLPEAIELNSTDVRKLVIAFCRGQVFDSELLLALLDKATASLNDYNTQSQASMLVALARINRPHEEFITMVCRNLVSNHVALSLHEVVAVLTALSKMQVYDAALFDATTAHLASHAAQLDVEDLRSYLLAQARLKKRGVSRDDSKPLAILISDCLRPQLRRLETREVFQVFFSLAELNALDGPFIRERLIPIIRKRLSEEKGLRSAALAIQLLSRLPFTCAGATELNAEAISILETATSADAAAQPAALAAGAVAGAKVWDALEEAGPEPLARLRDGEFSALAAAAGKEGRLLHAVKVERLRRSS